MLTLDELLEKIAEQTDEVSILELLNINSFDLVERFSDKIEDRYEELVEKYDE